MHTWALNSDFICCILLKPNALHRISLTSRMYPFHSLTPDQMVLSLRRRQLRERAASGEPAERVQPIDGMVSGQAERCLAAGDPSGLREHKLHN